MLAASKSERKLFTVDELLATLTGPEKIAALLTRGGETQAAAASKMGVYAADLSNTLRGKRQHPQIRERIAAHLRVALAEVDTCLGQVHTHVTHG